MNKEKIDCSYRRHKFTYFIDYTKRIQNGCYYRVDSNGYKIVGQTCHTCKLRKQRVNRFMNNNKSTKKYEKTINGFLVRVYRNMKSRVNGVQWKKSHLYKNKCLLDKKDFYKWSKGNLSFYKLFKEWLINDYKRSLCPSVDRIDSSLGYKIENMRWVTFSENCRNVRQELKRKPKRKSSIINSHTNS